MRRSTDKRRPITDEPAARVILGVDPGTLVTGYGVLAIASGGAITLLTAGTVKNSPQQAIPERLHRIFSELNSVIRKFSPSEFAIESSFYGKNAQSALKLGQARGVALLAAVSKKVPCYEYSPREVKRSVVGNGAAGKHQVQYMVRSALHLDDRPLLLDASDAIAVALCHLYRTNVNRPTPPPRSWKAFVASHPERVLR
ncbi:MAG: crossover junction endodeoxyribonuclease RuvC [Bacteroidota bacterium]